MILLYILLQPVLLLLDLANLQKEPCPAWLTLCGVFFCSRCIPAAFLLYALFAILTPL